jgi:hypothetical protein
VDQISPPFRIALVALLALCALWFTVLRPKPPVSEAPLPVAPGATGLANDVNTAKGAAAASDAANAKTQAATGGTAATSSSKPASSAHAAVAGKSAATTSEPKAKAKAGTRAAGDRSAPLLRALDHKRVVVLLFWNRRGLDDRAVRRAVLAISRHGGRVVVKAVPVSHVGRYGAITNGAQVLQSPTALVIAPGGKARAIVGFTTTGEVDQAVADALATVKRGA